MKFRVLHKTLGILRTKKLFLSSSKYAENEVVADQALRKKYPLKHILIFFIRSFHQAKKGHGQIMVGLDVCLRSYILNPVRYFLPRALKKNIGPKSKL